MLAFGYVDKSKRSLIFGQQLEKRNIDAEQFVKRIFVFDTIQSTRVNTSFCSDVFARNVVKKAFKFLDEVSPLIRLDERVLGRGHLMVADAIIEVGPEVHVGVTLWIERQGLQIELPFSFYIIVALVAIEIQELGNGLWQFVSGLGDGIVGECGY